MRAHPPYDALATGHGQCRGQSEPAERGAARAGVPDQKGQARQPGQLGLVAVGAERDVITEPGSHLGRIGHAPDPRQHRDEEQRTPFIGQPHPFGQPAGDPPRPEYVLHRLTQSQVGRQRERRQQLREGDTRIPLAAVHPRSVGRPHP